jgi:hypothetical protein
LYTHALVSDVEVFVLVTRPHQCTQTIFYTAAVGWRQLPITHATGQVARAI